MRINTGEIEAEGVEDLDMSSAVKVDMNDVQIVAFDTVNDADETLLFTEGVGPCITIIMVGKVKETLVEEISEQRFVAMYHWDGGNQEGVQLPSHLIQQECGKELARRCLARMIKNIDRILCDKSEKEYAEYKIIIDDMAILGGERAQKNLSGTEMQVYGLHDFLNSPQAKLQFKQDYHVNLPKLKQTNFQAFKASDTNDMDVYVSLDEDSELQVQYVMRDTAAPQHSADKSDTCDEDVDNNELDKAAEILTMLKYKK